MSVFSKGFLPGDFICRLKIDFSILNEADIDKVYSIFIFDILPVAYPGSFLKINEIYQRFFFPIIISAINEPVAEEGLGEGFEGFVLAVEQVYFVVEGGEYGRDCFLYFKAWNTNRKIRHIFQWDSINGTPMKCSFVNCFLEFRGQICVQQKTRINPFFGPEQAHSST